MIESLTKEQEEKLEDYKNRGIELGLSTERIDRKAAESYAERIMKWLGRNYKGTIFVEGPIEAWKKVCELSCDKEEDIEELKKNFISPYFVGQFLSYYAAWADYYKEVLGLKLPEYWQLKEQVEFGMVYPLDEYVVISERPELIKIDNGELHSDDSPAVQYRDGTKVYSIHGVSVPEHVVKNPKTITIDEINKEENEEVKRIMLERYGYDKYLSDTNAELVDCDVDTYNGSRALMKTSDMVFLVAADPSTGRVYYLEVSPECKTCVEADKYLSGLDDYEEVKQIGRT